MVIGVPVASEQLWKASDNCSKTTGTPIIEKVGEIFRAKGVSVINMSMDNLAMMPH
jgi:hypothetical protein